MKRETEGEEAKGSGGSEETRESESVGEEAVGEHGGECGEDLVVGSMR